MKITLKSFKPAHNLSEETLAFTATIYADGKRVGDVRNQGNGGCHFYNWSDANLGREIEAWADAQPSKFEFEKLDQIIDKVIEDLEVQKEEKRIARAAKKSTLFRIKGDDDSSWRQVNVPYGPQAQAYLDKKYGALVTEIYGR